MACQICEKECPPKCIYIVKSADKKPDATGKPQFYPAQFDIDISVCMSCQICVEVCPFDAIKMDVEFEMSSEDRFGGLLLDKYKLAKSNEYYNKIHPTEAGAVDAALAEERAKAKLAAEAKAKKDAEVAAAKRSSSSSSLPQRPRQRRLLKRRLLPLRRRLERPNERSCNENRDQYFVLDGADVCLR